MHNVSIRKASAEDISAIMSIYESAKAFMRRQGNLTQWVNGYPGKKEIENDIRESNLYVGVDDDGAIAVVFAFIVGDDPTYDKIDGEWLNDRPYGTIHRIASSGMHSGMLAKCVEFCFGTIDNIRIDTHRNNCAMLEALKRNRFRRCGVIICADGTPREAFQSQRI